MHYRINKHYVNYIVTRLSSCVYKLKGKTTFFVFPLVF